MTGDTKVFKEDEELNDEDVPSVEQNYESPQKTVSDENGHKKTKKSTSMNRLLAARLDKLIAKTDMKCVMVISYLMKCISYQYLD